VIGSAVPRGILIGAPRSGSGKTTLTLGLLRALRRRGVQVTGLKCGPDYIDPAFHSAATGRPSLNLDSWAMKPELLQSLARHAGRNSDIIICEASMGLYDGVPAEQGRSGASADVAAALGLSVLLVLDVSGQAQSAAATVKGCMTYDPRIKVSGVVLNRVGSSRHRRLVSEAVEALGVPVVGSMPRSGSIVLPERHLGLVQSAETVDLDSRLDVIAEFVEEYVDIGRVVGGLTTEMNSGWMEPRVALRPPGQRIAIARDQAFSFIYPHILWGWRNMGAEILFFSPLADEPPPGDCDICWLPGGYPELHAARLASSTRFLAGLRSVASEKPVHGECGGYMTLGETLTDASGVDHQMAGLLGVRTSFAKRKMQLGYRDACLAATNCLGARGTRLKGHEFHYASVVTMGTDEPFATVADAYGGDPAPAGSRRGLVTGSFFHVIAEEVY
jgi:cobyrinic acid a,c-diamide synthase